MKAKLCDVGIDEGRVEYSPGITVGRASTGRLDVCSACADKIRAKTLRIKHVDIDRILAAEPAKFAALTGRPAPPPLAVRPPMPGTGFGGFTVTGLKQFQGMDGYGFNATVRFQGVAVGTAMNEGSGGPNRYDWLNKAARDAFAELTTELSKGKKYEDGDTVFEELMVGSERLKFLEKGRKAGAPFCYQIVPKAMDFGDGIVDERGVQYVSFPSQEKADARIARKDFVRASVILDDGSLGAEVKGNVVVKKDERELDEIIVPPPASVAGGKGSA